MSSNRKLDDALLQRGRAAWLRASVPEKEEAARHASDFISLLPFKGKRLTDHQGLAWPRAGVFRDDGAPVTGVPEEIKEATAIVAGFILAKVPFDVPAVAWVWRILGHLLEEQADFVDRKVTWH